MCQLCGEDMKSVRGLLAGKAIGMLTEENDTDLEPMVDSVIYEHSAKVAQINSQAAKEMVCCAEIRDRIINGIRKVLPTMTVEDRAFLAAAAKR